jgi:uncharacterized protein (TIGR03435 family)
MVAAGWMALTVSVIFGMLRGLPIYGETSPATKPATSFEVATIKPTDPDPYRKVDIGITFSPGRFHVKGQTVNDLIKFAYNIKSDDRITGEPTWVNTDRYDIEAKVEDSLASELQKLPSHQQREQIGRMVQSLLASRFDLTCSHGTKVLSVYNLVVAKNPPKLVPTKVAPPAPANSDLPEKPVFRGMKAGGGRILAQSAPVSQLVDALNAQPEIGGRTVLDKTGLKGAYDFSLQWTPQQTLGSTSSETEVIASLASSSGPSLFVALQEQLGLKLESARGSTDVLVVEQIKKPTEN